MWQIEVTDTFAGESNYSWVKRGVVRSRDRRARILAAKELAGWPCRVRVTDYGDFMELRPTKRSGICQVAFLTWRD